jgi:hypothetical membrane protein
MNLRRIAPWAGMIGPAVFVMVFLIEGWLRPGYNWLSTYVSDLSIGPRGWIQILNFLIVGTALFIFSRGAAAEFRSGKASRWGVILLTVLSICFFVSGPFVTDPIGTPREQVTTVGLVHGIFGAVVFVCMPICIFVFLRRFREDPRWQSLRGWTLFLGILCAIGSILLTLFTKSNDLLNLFKDWVGLIQRTAIIPFMVWVFLFGLTWLRHSRPAPEG